MKSLEPFFRAIDYRITDAWEHQWLSYERAQVLETINDFAGMSVTFRRDNQEIIEINARSELEAREQHAYRWINAKYLEAIKAESKSRGIDHRMAGEDLRYIDVEVPEDVLEKGRAMLANEPFDTRVSVPLELEDDVLLTLFRLAHERDITFNQLCAKVVEDFIASSQPKS